MHTTHAYRVKPHDTVPPVRCSICANSSSAVQKQINNILVLSIKASRKIRRQLLAPRLPQPYILVYISEMVLSSRERYSELNTCAVLGWVGTKNHGKSTFSTGVLVAWENRDIMSVGTIWIGLGKGRLLWYGFDVYENCDI